MIKDFEKELDGLLASCGLEKIADVTGTLPPTSNLVHDDAGLEGLDAKRKPKQGIPAMSNIKNSALPEGKGSLNDMNGSPVRQVFSRVGGMDVLSAYKAIRGSVKASALKKLGSAHEISNQQLIGMLEIALENKYVGMDASEAKTKLAQDPLFKQYKALIGKTKEAFGASTLEAIKELLAGGYAFGKVLSGSPIQPKEDALQMRGKFQSFTPKGGGPLNP